MRIELRGARKRFGKVEALRGIDLTIPGGRRVALVGPNGSGKSTLIRALLGLVDCEGEVRIDGPNPYESRVELARRLAYVPQIAPALGASVNELVALVCLTRELPRAEVERMAERLALDLASVGRRPFRNLSGGTKQKVLLAIAFASHPELLVLDEPTASLDEDARRRFLELCGELPASTTVILCSHRLEEVSHLTDHVLALHEGQVRYDGPAAGYVSAVAGAPARPAPLDHEHPAAGVCVLCANGGGGA
jgi:ABC-type multidrug transport system ATPase subunit